MQIDPLCLVLRSLLTPLFDRQNGEDSNAHVDLYGVDESGFYLRIEPDERYWHQPVCPGVLEVGYVGREVKVVKIKHVSVGDNDVDVGTYVIPLEPRYEVDVLCQGVVVETVRGEVPTEVIREVATVLKSIAKVVGKLDVVKYFDEGRATDCTYATGAV